MAAGERFPPYGQGSAGRRGITGHYPQNSTAASAKICASFSTDSRSTHSTSACAPAPAAPNTTVSTPAACSRAASIHGVSPMCAARVPNTFSAARSTAFTIAAPGETSNGSRTKNVGPRVKIAIRFSQPVDNLLNFADRLRFGLAGNRSALDFHDDCAA